MNQQSSQNQPRFAFALAAAVAATLALAPALYAQPAAQPNPAQPSGQVAPIPSQTIYPEVDAAKAEIQQALRLARRTHKRVLLDFGGNWCGDCQVLNIYFHQSPNAELLKRYFVLVDINIGHIDANIDIAEKYGVPLKKGVPALAVLDAQGNTLFAQKGGEFEDMRHMQSADLTAFLNRWKR